ncbi:DUF4058 family protein [Tautonia plasticadhaerens]|uniref:DUF4058 domain-containing protein n=1 Tax=Tautonia plasticadhaerens TaxID=2527974 RepID=A0A518HCH3_9BACT|nr:DUF4058 family protein [Tautonia plasticadhaerens]QDV38565.1 hypothetical protein ElP_65200 [Tautonia plasticadhaerens]
MPSPFPGMDPYLESPAFWSDFHAGFLVCLRNAIFDRLPPGYEARIDERLSLAGPSGDSPKRVEPDVAVLRDPDRPVPGEGPAVAVAPPELTLVPVAVPLRVGRRRQRLIKILKRPDRTLVTVIELLSPSNKAGDDRGAYLLNRQAILAQPVHLLELDLLRKGRRLPAAAPLPKGDYYAMLSRAGRRPICEVFAWPIRWPLPRLPVPLLAPDPDVVLDLQAAFTTAFEQGRYESALPYDDPPPAPPSEADRGWFDERRAAARRA